MTMRADHQPVYQPYAERERIATAVLDETARLHRLTAALAEQTQRLGALSELVRDYERAARKKAAPADTSAA